MRTRVKSTKASLQANRAQLNDLADTVRSLSEFDSAHRHEMQEQIVFELLVDKSKISGT